MMQNKTQDIVLPWHQVVKNDLIVLHGKWWRVDFVNFKYVNTENGYDDEGKWIDPWTEEDHLKNRDIESNGYVHPECNHRNSIMFRLRGIEDQNYLDYNVFDTNDKVRVRPVGGDPWEGRRKEGRF